MFVLSAITSMDVLIALYLKQEAAILHKEMQKMKREEKKKMKIEGETVAVTGSGELDRWFHGYTSSAYEYNYIINILVVNIFVRYIY